MRSTLICLFLHVLSAIQLSKFTQVQCSSHGVTCRTTQVAMTFMQWEGSCSICDLIENQSAQGRLRLEHRPSRGLEQEQYVECDTTDSSCNTSLMSHAKKNATRTESSHIHNVHFFRTCAAHSCTVGSSTWCHQVHRCLLGQHTSIDG